MLQIQGDVFVFGGKDQEDVDQTEIYKLSCYNEDCTWTTLNQTLKIKRSHLVAIAVPDSFCTL